MTKKNGSISERTAINWLKKLGYVCKDVRKEYTMMGMNTQMWLKLKKNLLEEMKKVRKVSCQL